MNKRIIFYRPDEMASHINFPDKEMGQYIKIPNPPSDEVLNKLPVADKALTLKRIKAFTYITDIEKTRRCTEEEWLKFQIMDQVPEGAKYEIVDEADLPQDSTFKRAFVKNGDKWEVDIDKARVCQMNTVKSFIKPAVVKIKEQIEDLEDEGEDTTALIAKRKKIKALPKTLDFSVCKTTDELKAAWPSDLPRL